MSATGEPPGSTPPPPGQGYPPPPQNPPPGQAYDPGQGYTPPPPGYAPPPPGYAPPPGYGAGPSYQPYAAAGPSGPRAGFWIRFGALILDGLLLGIPLGIIDAVVLKNSAAGQYALNFIVAISYFAYLEGGPRGQTVGKMAVGIRVVDFNTGGPIGYGRAALRYVGSILSEIAILLGYLWMLWDREKQTWHDKFANSVVVPVQAYPIAQ